PPSSEAASLIRGAARREDTESPAALSAGPFPLNACSVLERFLGGILDAADGVLRLAGDLVGFAFALQLGIAGHLADGFLHFAFGRFEAAFEAVFVHAVLVRVPIGESMTASAERSIAIARMRSGDGPISFVTKRAIPFAARNGEAECAQSRTAGTGPGRPSVLRCKCGLGFEHRDDQVRARIDDDD